MPGTEVGPLTEELANEVGFQCQVVLPATHDTGSAVLAVPSNEDPALYISSGTWSLMGTERREVDCSEESRKRNFTNEGGYEYRFRYLKNIMGLWIDQSGRRACSRGGSIPLQSCVRRRLQRGSSHWWTAMMRDSLLHRA